MTPKKPGAKRGRPVSARSKLKIHTRLSRDVIAWAKSTGNAAGAIEQAVRSSVEFRLWAAELNRVTIIAKHDR